MTGEFAFAAGAGDGGADGPAALIEAVSLPLHPANQNVSRANTIAPPTVVLFILCVDRPLNLQIMVESWSRRFLRFGLGNRFLAWFLVWFLVLANALNRLRGGGAHVCAGVVVRQALESGNDAFIANFPKSGSSRLPHLFVLIREGRRQCIYRSIVAKTGERSYRALANGRRARPHH